MLVIVGVGVSAQSGEGRRNARAEADYLHQLASALDLLSNARRHLALADADLQLCLPLVGGGARAAD